MNFRILAPVSAGIAVVAGIVSTTLWQELRAERKTSAALRAEMAGSTGHAPAPLLTPHVDSVVPVPPQSTTDAPLSEAMALPASPKATGAIAISELERLKDPDYRKARLAETLPTIAQHYPGLVEELRLTTVEAERLFALLAEARLDMAAEAAAVEGQELDAEAAAQISRNRRNRQRQQGESLRALLGDARYAQWQEYQRTQSSRLQASTYANALAQAGVPLDSSQTRTVAIALIEEQERLRQDIVSLARNVNLQNPQTQVQAQAALKRRQDESTQRVLDAVYPWLSASQLRVLRQHIGQQDALEPPASSGRVR